MLAAVAAAWSNQYYQPHSSTSRKFLLLTAFTPKALQVQRRVLTPHAKSTRPDAPVSPRQTPQSTSQRRSFHHLSIWASTIFSGAKFSM